jgi:hypothetical protein
LSRHGPLLVVGRLIRRSRRSGEKNGRPRTVVTYEVQGSNGGVVRVTVNSNGPFAQPGEWVALAVVPRVVTFGSGPAVEFRQAALDRGEEF